MKKQDIETALLDACSALGVPSTTVNRDTILKTICPDLLSVRLLVENAQHTVHSTLVWKKGDVLPKTLGDLIDQVWNQKMGHQTNTAC